MGIIITVLSARVDSRTMKNENGSSLSFCLFLYSSTLQIQGTRGREFKGKTATSSSSSQRRTQGFILAGHKLYLERIKALVQLEIGCFMSHSGQVRAYRLLF